MPTTPNSSTPSNPKGQIKTKIGTDKDRLFLFAQFAAILNAGLNPAQAFHDVANRTAPHYKASVLALADAATNGTDLASVMEEYPDLYPEDVVGITRAGQVGGFLGDAFQEVSRQAESSHKFRRWFFWVWFVFLNALIGIPGMLWGTQALVRGWELIDKNGGQGGFSEALRSMGRSYLELLGWPFGPGFAALCLALLFLSKAFPSRRTKRLRHRLGLQFPVYGPRARHENLARFSWVMDRLSRAGLAPARSYALAAECVPNLEMRDRLKEVADRLDGAEKMSDIFTGAKLFPEEYAAIVATAEYTGDLPRAFEQITRASEAEFQTAQNYAKARSGCWGMLGCFITSAAMIGILWWVWYHQLPAKILEGFE